MAWITKSWRIWTSADPEVARSAAFMYARNSKLQGWWDQVQLIVWGPSAKTLAGDAGLQSEVGLLVETGVEVTACKACADMYEAGDTLKGIGVNVRYMGQPLTEMLKTNWRVIAF